MQGDECYVQYFRSTCLCNAISFMKDKAKPIPTKVCGNFAGDSGGWNNGSNMLDLHREPLQQCKGMWQKVMSGEANTGAALWNPWNFSNTNFCFYYLNHAHEAAAKNFWAPPEPFEKLGSIPLHFLKARAECTQTKPRKQSPRGSWQAAELCASVGSLKMSISACRRTFTFTRLLFTK